MTRKKAGGWIVSSVKIAPNPVNNTYRLVSAGGVRSVRSPILLEVLDRVDIGSTEGEGQVAVAGRAAKKEYRMVMDGLVDDSGIVRNARDAGKSGIDDLDVVTRAMMPNIVGAAAEVVRSLLSGAPVMVRFHNDCDGASGAVGLFDAISSLQGRTGLEDMNMAWQMNRSIAYSNDLAQSDRLVFNSYSSVEMPLVLITDFGTSQESEAAISAYKGVYNFVWLDHHPIYAGFPKGDIPFYINPWDFGGNSDYTAGFLAGTFAEVMAPISAAAVKRASLIGDYSTYADREDARSVRISAVLDYMTGKKEFQDNVTPKYMRSVIEDDGKLMEMFGYVTNMFNESIEVGLKNVKHYRTRDNVGVHVLDFAHIAAMGDEYPLPGRYSSKLHERMEALNGDRTVTVVHYGSYISVRVSRGISEWFGLLGRMEIAKGSSDCIYSFGGHNSAASVRSDKDHIATALRHLLSAMGVP